MNKLLIALTVGAFAFGSIAAFADDKTPAAPVDQAKLKADKDAAKAAAAKMTPEEKAAAKKAKGAARQKEEAQIEKVGQPNAPAKEETRRKSVDATKGDPTALPTKEDKQKALKEQEKKSSGQ